jgi:antitoxin component of RelBE/YafQ-DinJ toxin-antitoxin module
MANTPLRSFRISDEIYNDAKTNAEQAGLNVTEIILSSLIRFNENPDSYIQKIVN